MTLYLVRHGEALQDRDDSRRPLSPAGRRQVEDVARRVMDAGAKPARILHSGKLRAQETAEILAAVLGPMLAPMLAPEAVRAIAGLLPEDDPASAVELAQHSDEDLMLVGHLPHLGIVASKLLGAGETVSFSTSTMACFERDARWKLRWKITGESR